MDIEKIILKKKLNQPLSSEELEYTVKGFVSKEISKNKMEEFLKTIFIFGMSECETFSLTKIMTDSGKTLSFKNKNLIYADKHSTGGISDSTTLIISPIIACAGIGFLKMSGRKLGFTGGTIDKLESFSGYNADISISDAEKLVEKNGAALISQTEDLAPADKHIYKLRDETNTIMSIPLIASSIMSKKLALENDIIVIDVKCGNGAFIKNKKEAVYLAKLMIKIGENAGRKMAVFITDMNQPLGHCVGSFVETVEAINVLKGATGRLRDLSVNLASKIIQMAKQIPQKEADAFVMNILNSGKALNRFKSMIKDQGGSLDLFNNSYVKKLLGTRVIITAKREGFVFKFDLERLGNEVRRYCSLGNYGIKLLVEIGDFVEKDSSIIELYGKESSFDFGKCIHFSKNKKITNNLIIDVL